MQSKINKTKDQVVNKLNKLNIEFHVEGMDIEREDLSEKFIGYRVVSLNLMGCIVPNLSNNRPEFLIFNEKLVQHLISEGHTDEYIENNGKIWLHLSKQEDFVKVFEQASQFKIN
jgi:hypothetical protein